MLTVKEHGPIVKLQVARTILGRALYHAAAYWVDGLLIDTGCAFTASELVKATAFRPVKQIVNTHSHEDHIGGNALLQQLRGVPILAHPLALPILANPRLQYLQFYRRVFWGWPQPSSGSAVGDRVETAHHCFEVIRTPGHSSDHICLYEPEQGWLFSGDAYIGGRERAARVDYDVYAIIESLKKLATLGLSWLFPGSGTVRADPVEDIRGKIAYLEELGEEVHRLHAMGLAVRTIKKRLLGREPHITYLTLGHFGRAHLISSFLRGMPTRGSAMS